MKTTIGIDIGTESIKLVCLEHDKDLYKLVSYGKISFRGDVQKLKDFVSRSQLTAKDIRINIEDSSIKVRRLDLPDMPKDELPEAVRWGMKDVVEGDVETFAFQFTNIDPEDFQTKDKKTYIVFAVKNSAIDKQFEFVKEVGLRRPVIMEPDSAALASSFAFSKGDERAEYSALVDFGSGVSLFTVMGKKGLMFSRPLVGCADGNLVDRISRDTGVDIKRAEFLKNTYFKGENVGLSEETLRLFKNTIAHFFSKIALEIQRSIDGFIIAFERRKISSIYCCGGGAYQTGLLEYLNQTIGVPCEIFDPFEKIDVSDFASENFNKTKALYAVACGLSVD